MKLKTMSVKKEKPFILIIIAAVIGFTLFKQFNFQTLSFAKPAIAVVYCITFAMTLYLIYKDNKKK
jgi:uncharacterized membrane protein